jgi:hypothetical protein
MFGEIQKMETMIEDNINPLLENDDDISIWDITLMDGLEDEDFSDYESTTD